MPDAYEINECLLELEQLIEAIDERVSDKKYESASHKVGVLISIARELQFLLVKMPWRKVDNVDQFRFLKLQAGQRPSRQDGGKQ